MLLLHVYARGCGGQWGVVVGFRVDRKFEIQCRCCSKSRFRHSPFRPDRGSSAGRVGLTGFMLALQVAALSPQPRSTLLRLPNNTPLLPSPLHSSTTSTVETEISVQIFSVQRLSAQATFRDDCDSHSALQSTLYSDQGETLQQDNALAVFGASKVGSTLIKYAVTYITFAQGDNSVAR